jgi:hypothetical protein
MARIIVHRTNEFNNRLRQYGIYIDGTKVGDISNGQALEFNVPAGRHTIISKINWCSSPELTVDVLDNETKNFTVGSFKYGKWIMPIAVIIVVIGVFFRKTPGLQYVVYLSIPLLLILIYYLTFGRKQYLSLKEGGGIF